MLVRIFEQPDGTLSIIRPNARMREEGEGDQAFIDRIAGAAMAGDSSLAGLPFTDLDESALPQDRTLRNAWRLKDGKVT